MPCNEPDSRPGWSYQPWCVMTLIETRGLTVRLGKQLVLFDIDLAVERGEIVTIVGPNGSGKSTLLRALIGAVTVTGGSIIRAQGLRIGYVPQRLHIDGTLPITVARFLRLGARRRSVDVAGALEETGVPDLAERQMTALSGGQFQRVLLARALLSSPDLLLLDEPAQGLDHPGIPSLYRLIDALRTRLDCAVLMVSHDLHVVLSATDRVIGLQGVIWYDGDPRKMVTGDVYQEMFGIAGVGALAAYAEGAGQDQDRTA